MSVFPLQSGANYLISNVPYGSILTCYNTSNAVVGWAGDLYNNFTLSEWTLTEIAVGIWTIQEIFTGYYLGLAGSSAVCAPDTASTSWGISSNSTSNSDLILSIFEPSDASLSLTVSGPVPGIPVVIASNSDQTWTFVQQ